MFSNALNTFGNAALDFGIQFGQIVLIAALYLLIAYVIVRVLLSRVKDSPMLIRFGKNGSMIAFRLISIGIYLIAIVGILSHVGVNTSGILTLMSAFTVAAGLALQDVMRNMISGVFMLIEKPFSVGDRVTIRERVGTVQGIDIRTTMLRTDEGSLLMVPNSLMFTEILQNDSRYNMRLIKYTVRTSLPPHELMVTLEGIAASLEGIRPPLAPPMLIQYEDDHSTWNVNFSVNARQMSHDHEIGEALVAAMPEATITRVP